MFSTRIPFHYVQNIVARRFSSNCNIDRTTAQTETLFEARTFNHKPALFFPGQLEKIKGAAFGRNIPNEIRAVHGKDLRSGTVARLEVKNAIVTPKYVFSGSLRQSFYDDAPFSFFDSLDSVETAALPSSFLGCNYFGHWVGDDCATHILAKEITDTPLIMPTPSWSEKTDYARRFVQDWTPSQPTFCRTLSLYVDHGQNPHKAERLHRLRQRIRSKPALKPNEIVYLKRGPQSSSRNLVNEEEVIAVLRDAGCVIHEAESGIGQLEAVALDARIIIGVEGSQLCHALYMLRDGGGLFILQPPNRFFTSNLDWCRAMGFECALMVGDETDAGFTMDLDVLKHSLDFLDTALP